MNVDRRDFFKVLSAGVLTAVNADKVLAAETDKYRRSADAVGILYDATVCIGCRACEMGCKHANNLPPDPSALDQKYGVSNIWDSAADTTPKSYLKIKLYKDGDGTVKNRAKNGYSFAVRRNRRSVQSHSPGGPTHSENCQYRRSRAYHRRKRYGKRAGSPRHSQSLFA